MYNVYNRYSTLVNDHTFIHSYMHTVVRNMTFIASFIKINRIKKCHTGLTRH